MTERYDAIAATHYAAYRPPLHRMILQRLLSPEESFSIGVDIGCGTGCSAIALAEYCDHVHGIDPSVSMLTEAADHERVTYIAGTAEQVPLLRNRVDIVTLGGSLHYADREATAAALRTFCKRNATVVVYDFRVRLEPVLDGLGMDPRATESDYDHCANLSGVRGLLELELVSRIVHFGVSAPHLAHLLLSDSYRLDHFVSRYRMSDPFPVLVTALQRECGDVSLAAELYGSRYGIVELDPEYAPMEIETVPLNDTRG